MKIERSYELRVCSKYQQSDSWTIRLIPLDEEWELLRPYWTIRQADGSPLEMRVSAEEYAAVEIGDKFATSISWSDER